MPSEEERLREARDNYEALGDTPAPCAIDDVLADVPFLLDVADDVPGLLAERDALLAEVGRLTAERDALKENAALGALVRRLPETARHIYTDETSGAYGAFRPEWMSLTLEIAENDWYIEAGAVSARWVDDSYKEPEIALAHVLGLPETEGDDNAK